MELDIKTIEPIKPTKEVMMQYNCIQDEIEKLKKSIADTENTIEKLLESGSVCDKVNGGLGGIQGFKIEGFPIREYNRRRKILENKHKRLIERENDLLELKESIEVFIDKIQNSRDRQMFVMIFVDKKTQQEVADYFHIDRSLVSKIISKYIQVSHNSR